MLKRWLSLWIFIKTFGEIVQSVYPLWVTACDTQLFTYETTFFGFCLKTGSLLSTMTSASSSRTEQICCCDQCVGGVQLRPQNNRFGHPLAPKLGALANNSSLLWRSRSFAGGLALGQPQGASTPADKFSSSTSWAHKSALIGNNNSTNHSEPHRLFDQFTADGDVPFGQPSATSGNNATTDHNSHHQHLPHHHQQQQQLNGKNSLNGTNTVAANAANRTSEVPLAVRLNRHSSTASDDSWVMAAGRTAASGFPLNMSNTTANNINSGNTSKRPLSSAYTSVTNANGTIVARTGSLNSSQNSAHHSSRTGSQCSNEQPTSSSCNTPGDVSLSNASAMRHSQSDHSYLSAKARNPLTGVPLSAGNIISQQTTLDASSLSSLGSSASGSLSRSELTFFCHRFSLFLFSSFSCFAIESRESLSGPTRVASWRESFSTWWSTDADIVQHSHRDTMVITRSCSLCVCLFHLILVLLSLCSDYNWLSGNCSCRLDVNYHLSLFLVLSISFLDLFLSLSACSPLIGCCFSHFLILQMLKPFPISAPLGSFSGFFQNIYFSNLFFYQIAFYVLICSSNQILPKNH